MSRAFLTKTSFTAGELDPLLRGRLDLPNVLRHSAAQRDSMVGREAVLESFEQRLLA